MPWMSLDMLMKWGCYTCKPAKVNSWSKIPIKTGRNDTRWWMEWPPCRGDSHTFSGRQFIILSHVRLSLRLQNDLFRKIALSVFLPFFHTSLGNKLVVVIVIKDLMCVFSVIQDKFCGIINICVEALHDVMTEDPETGTFKEWVLFLTFLLVWYR